MGISRIYDPWFGGEVCMPGDDRYTLIRKIGQGAMGEVYLAEDNLLKRKVALKFLSLPEGLDRAARSEAHARFYREAQAAARLSHPNIVVVYDVEEMGGRPYISMEYLEGETLDRVLERGPLPPQEASRIVSQVLDALSYAHSQGVIHRDIKPENIFLTPGGTVKVTDFGIARLSGTSTMTQAGTVMGTPGYMSPEQVKGEEVDHRTDIFSCGVLLYELLTGKKAFSGPSLTAVLYRVVNEELPPLRELDPSLPPHLEGIVRRATEKDPARRYPEASLMARDLREGAFTPAQETVLLSPPSAPTLHLSPPPSTLVRPPGELPASPLPEALPSPRRRTSLWVLISALASLLIIGGGVLSFLLLSSSRVTVPDVVGLDVEEARSVLERAGLKLEVAGKVPRSDAEEDEVIAQSPAAGKKVEKGNVVKVDICRIVQEAAMEPGRRSELESQVRSRLNAWELAWESRDINAYMSFYSPDFYCSYNPKMANYALLQQHKGNLFRTYSWIQLEISEVQVFIESDNTAQTTFKQLYTCSDARANDFGQKTLKWKLVNGQWLIYNEEWYEIANY